MLNSEGVAPLCDKSLILKKRVSPLYRSYGENYININALYNAAGTGIMQKLKPLEDHIFDLSQKRLDVWRKNADFKKEIPEFYRLIDNEIKQQYLNLFGI